jgi:hypothetical protein
VFRYHGLGFIAAGVTATKKTAKPVGAKKKSASKQLSKSTGGGGSEIGNGKRFAKYLKAGGSDIGGAPARSFMRTTGGGGSSVGNGAAAQEVARW